MALPPDPIEEVLSQASGAVLAEVVKVVKEDPVRAADRLVDPQLSDAPTQAPRQVVELKVTGVLFGAPGAVGTTLQAVKPAGAYALRAGNKGPFLLTKVGDALEILGRYGPDTYSERAINETAKQLKK